MLERMQVMELKPTPSKPTENPCLAFERSYLYSHSKYGYRSPFNIARPDMNKMFSVLYRDKLYFFANEDEKNLFMMTPDIYCRNPTVPKDVWLKPTCFVIGTPS
jgi:YHS domain-containing protein